MFALAFCAFCCKLANRNTQRANIGWLCCNRSTDNLSEYEV